MFRSAMLPLLTFGAGRVMRTGLAVPVGGNSGVARRQFCVGWHRCWNSFVEFF
jgi:hypothetical protein